MFLYFVRLTDIILLTDLKYFVKETFFERLLPLTSTDMPFFNWNCVDFFDIPLAACRELFVKVHDWWECYERACLL